MGREPFTAPTERPVDAAARANDVNSTSDAGDISAGSTENWVQFDNNSGEDHVITRWTIAAISDSDAIYFEASVTDENDTALHVYGQRVDAGSLDFSPPLYWPSGGHVVIKTVNQSGGSVTGQTGIISRPVTP